VEIRTYPVKIRGKTLVLGIARDITERKRAENELKQTSNKLRQALGSIVKVIALTVEQRDPCTAGHQNRVANLARAIAIEMALSEDHIEGVYTAGIIHDIGKISVPAEILSKPSKLSEIEFSLIKEHAKIGYEILKEIEFPWPIAQIVYQHHERINGSGYPQGLSGEDIFLEARILGVADAVEAMASHRPYRPAHGLEKALEEISKNRGILYDPGVVDACLKIFAKKKFKLNDKETATSGTYKMTSKNSG
jgi:putative nucleotidyltransferase with HDIG domain